MRQVNSTIEQLKLGDVSLFNTLFQREVGGALHVAEDGFHFFFDKIVEVTDEGAQIEPVDILLTAEERLDEEDLSNLNEILETYNLSFIEYKED